MRVAGLALLGLLALPVEAEPWTPSLVYPSVAGADLLSTYRALEMDPQAREGNPFMRGSLQEQLVIKALATAGAIWLDLRLQREGRRRVVWILRGLWILAHALVVRHNLGVGR